MTASDMMYRDLQAFRERTHKPVIVSMMDVCASGGYYVSCASDYHALLIRRRTRARSA